MLPESRTNLKTVFGGAGAIYAVALAAVLFVVWARPPVPDFIRSQIEPFDISKIIFENVAGPSGGGGGGGQKAPAPTPVKTAPTPAIKPPEPLPEPIPIPEPPQPPPPIETPPAATVPAIASNADLSAFDPSRPPAPGANVGNGGTGAGGGNGPGIGPGNGPGLGPGDGGNTGGGVYGPGSVDQMVIPLLTPKPAYTSQAMLRRIQGEVTLSCIVLATGEVGKCEITKSLDSNNFGLDDEAMKAAKKFKFKPAMRKGQPVAVRVNIVLDFNMR
jgi:TonB family protein